MNNTLEKNKICAVIPFYNESSSIKKIIFDTLDYADKVIAVNDGSTDNSAHLIPQNEKLILISYQKNMGKGYALKRGFEESLKIGSEFTITLDADLQHNPNLIPKMLSEKFDIIIGNRLNDISRMPFHRRLSNKITSFLLRLKTGQKILDSQCGFRSYKTKTLKNIFPKSNGFESESEIIVLAARKKYKIGFVDIPTVYENEKSKMRAFKTIIGFIKVMFI